MRLIDADAFMEYLGLDTEVAREENLGVIVGTEDLDRQPTAYDVDKVLEHISYLVKPTEQYRHNFCGTVTDEHCAKYDVCESCMAEQICKVVKSGGIE